ncbi:hypothetical protein [Paenibacillus xylaniclasticus]|uniref:hypothetical protein n=1 Tax=Paenibacillus xylaniclasticus TaxID=588083 RepID=UPI0013DFA021|nr:MULTISPECIES: hypothetical protein [Paenibacillus]GFN30518.1 hypothetical protein PCURB6_07780 [Paenibacillus curdlanolyticus]
MVREEPLSSNAKHNEAHYGLSARQEAAIRSALRNVPFERTVNEASRSEMQT